MTSVGELHFLHQYLNDNYKYESWQKSICSCGMEMSACSFWREISNRLKQSNYHLLDMEVMEQLPSSRFLKSFYNLWYIIVGFFPFLKFTISSKNKNIISNSEQILKTIINQENATHIIESSKDVERGMLYNIFTRNFDKKYIFLVRDSRGVVASKMKWGISLEASAMSWVLNNLKAMLFKWSIPSSSKLVLRYEDFCRETEDTLLSIFNFLKLNPESLLIRSSFKQNHNIGGSPSRFNNSSGEIYLDEKWKINLTGLQIKKINKLTGWLNRQYGYAQ